MGVLIKEGLFLFITGLVQGLTEFLPVSSSAHLAFLEKAFAIKEDWRLSYTVFLHFGTFLALILFFGKRIIKRVKEKDVSLLGKIVVSSLPLLFAIPLRNLVANSFSRMNLIGFFLLLTGILIFATRFQRGEKEEISYLTAFLCGVFQLLAIFPGVSRSGATIAILLLLGIRGDIAFDFSFLLAIPAVGLANIYELFQVLSNGGLLFNPLIFFAILLSFLSGFFALFLLQRVVRRRGFYLFSFYLFLFGLFLLLLPYG